MQRVVRPVLWPNLCHWSAVLSVLLRFAAARQKGRQLSVTAVGVNTPRWKVYLHLNLVSEVWLHWNCFRRVTALELFQTCDCIGTAGTARNTDVSQTKLPAAQECLWCSKLLKILKYWNIDIIYIYLFNVSAQCTLSHFLYKKWYLCHIEGWCWAKVLELWDKNNYKQFQFTFLSKYEPNINRILISHWILGSGWIWKPKACNVTAIMFRASIVFMVFIAIKKK